MGNMIYETLIDWCSDNTNVRTVILTSSRANPDTKKDVLSDYDIELYVKDVLFFKESDEWIEALGLILIRWPLLPETTWSADWITRLIQFQDGTRIDLQITEKAPQYHKNFDAGYEVILDKDGAADGIGNPDYENLFIKKPGKQEFENLINGFFWDSLYVAKALWREELFYAKYMLDSVLRFHYQQIFIEWYIGSKNNWSVSTNKYGRDFKDYIEPDLWEKIERTFSGASISGNWNALLKMIDVAGILLKIVADKLGYTYAGKLEEGIIDRISHIKKNVCCH